VIFPRLTDRIKEIEIDFAVGLRMPFKMDADYDPTQKRVKMKKKKKGKQKPDTSATQEELTSRKRRRSKFAEALEKPKPQFDASTFLYCCFHALSLNLYAFTFMS